MQYVVLDKINKQKVMPNIKNYITAASIYIPITQKTKITLKINDYVYKEQEIIPGIYSPVSGFITSSSLKVNEKGQKVACLVIQNDGKEQYQKPKKNRENYQNYNQEKALELLNSFHFSKLNNIKPTLVINSVEDELNVATNIMILEKQGQIILDTLDALWTIFHFPNILLVLKENETSSVKKIMESIGRFPHIKLKLVPDYYGLGNNDILANYLSLNKEEVTFLSLIDILEISNLLKYNKVTTKKYITIAGDGVKKSQVINVKIGTLAKDIMQNCVSLKSNDDYLYIAGGLMRGKIVDINNLIVTKDLQSIFIISKKEEEKEEKCLNCGLCFKCCPMNINPKYIKENENISPDYINRCNNCNLCTYLCPAHISLGPFRKDDQ